MTSIKLIASGASARAEVDGLLTSGMVGIPVTIVCDGAWDGLTKHMVCRAGSIVKTILNVGNTATVAHECMVPNQTLYIGIEGRNADGTLVIPTVWALCGIIFSGATTDADPSADPTLPIWAQIQRAVGNLDDLNTEEKDNLVAAINEAMEKGGGEVDPEAVQQIVETYLAENPPAPGDTGPQGPQGEQGPAGPNGKSAYQYAVEGGYTGTESEFAAKLAAKYLPLSGGTMTGKIVFPAGNQNIGISSDGDVKIMGYGSGYFRFGDPGYPMQMRGSGANPLYGEKSILLEGDVYSKEEVDAALGAYINDVAALVGGDA